MCDKIENGFHSVLGHEDVRDSGYLTVQNVINIQCTHKELQVLLKCHITCFTLRWLCWHQGNDTQKYLH
jgi:hypothetical protein